MRGFIKSFSIYTLIVAISYVVFYLCAKSLIWGADFPATQLSKLNDWLIIFCTASDGIEAYVLHILLVCLMGLALLIPDYKSAVTKVFAYIAVFAVLTKLFTIPCQNYPLKDYLLFIQQYNVGVFIYIIGVIFLGYLLSKKALYDTDSKQTLIIFIFLLISFIIPGAKSDWFNNSYIFGPAYALDISSFRTIFIQYDLLLTGIAKLIMYLNLPLDTYYLLTRLSFFLVFFVLHKFSNRFFQVKNLAFYYIIYAVLLRYWANVADPATVFQTSAFRLELWVILVLLAYKFGIQHYSIGICLFLLSVLHRSFNLFYIIGYLEFVFFMLVSESIFIAKPDISEALKRFKSFLPNILLIVLGVFCSFLLFGNLLSPEMKLYNEYKIGFMRVHPTSFFWVLLLVIGYTALLLFKMKEKISKKYFETSFLIIFLLVGNLFYFFGRSHENNLLNISTNWALVLFIAFDLSILGLQKSTVNQKYQAYIFKIPIFIFCISSIVYAVNIFPKLQYKFNWVLNKEHSKFEDIVKKEALMDLRVATNESKKVYFYATGTDASDFYYTYYGHYKPQGGYYPYAAWIIKKDLLSFMQTLIDKDYYLVTSSVEGAEAMLPLLKFKHKYSYRNWMIVTNHAIPNLKH